MLPALHLLSHPLLPFLTDSQILLSRPLQTGTSRAACTEGCWPASEHAGARPASPFTHLRCRCALHFSFSLKQAVVEVRTCRGFPRLPRPAADIWNNLVFLHLDLSFCNREP